MERTTVAVTGVAGFLGQHLLPFLDAEPAVGRIIGLDIHEPVRRVPMLQFHRVDIASHELKPLLEGVDVLVHLAAILDPIADDELMARVNIDGARRVLDAAGAVGVRKIVRVSPSSVYGAWATNAMPLTEEAPLRPNPGFAPAVQAAEVERVMLDWADEHPAVAITTLRAAPVLGAGAEHLVARLLTRPGRPRLREETAPVQVVHVDDLARALVLAVRDDIPGVYNVAADGWLAAEEAEALLPRAALPPLPVEALRSALRRLWRSGLGEVPPSVIPYLEHPWVIANDRLEAAGWQPMHSNEETILETVDATPSTQVPWPVIAAAGGAAITGAAAGLFLRRCHRRRCTRA